MKEVNEYIRTNFSVPDQHEHGRDSRFPKSGLGWSNAEMYPDEFNKRPRALLKSRSKVLIFGDFDVGDFMTVQVTNWTRKDLTFKFDLAKDWHDAESSEKTLTMGLRYTLPRYRLVFEPNVVLSRKKGARFEVEFQIPDRFDSRSVSLLSLGVRLPHLSQGVESGNEDSLK